MRHISLKVLNTLPYEDRDTFCEEALRDGLATNRDIKIDNAYNEVTKRDSLIYKADGESSEAVRLMAYKDHKKRVRITKQQLLKQFKQSLHAYERSDHKGAFGFVARSIEDVIHIGHIPVSEVIDFYNDAIFNVRPAHKDSTEQNPRIISDPAKMAKVWSLIWDHLPLEPEAETVRLAAALIPVFRMGSGNAKVGLIMSLSQIHGRLVHESRGKQGLCRPAEVEHVVRRFAQSNKSHATLRDAAYTTLTVITSSVTAANDQFNTTSTVHEATGLWDAIIPPETSVKPKRTAGRRRQAGQSPVTPK